jgi:hypothetical protein
MMPFPIPPRGANHATQAQDRHAEWQERAERPQSPHFKFGSPS